MMQDLIIGVGCAIAAELLGDAGTKFSRWIVGRAVTRLPRRHRERWLQEWLGVLESRPRLLRPLFALDLFRAAFLMRRDYLRIAIARRGRSIASKRVGQIVQRAYHMGIAALALIFFSPAMVFIALAIRVRLRVRQF